MIGKKLEKALNDQLNFELYSAYIYMSMSADLKSRGYNGFANWLFVQTQEELVHVQKFYSHILERGGKVALVKVDGPKQSWKNALEAFQDAYEHETKVTARINDIVDLATKEKDHATANFLQWFITEQVEEEANTSDAVNQLETADGNPNAIMLLDRELGQRVFVPPPAAGTAAPGA